MREPNDTCGFIFFESEVAHRPTVRSFRWARADPTTYRSGSRVPRQKMRRAQRSSATRDGESVSGPKNLPVEPL